MASTGMRRRGATADAPTPRPEPSPIKRKVNATLKKIDRGHRNRLATLVWSLAEPAGGGGLRMVGVACIQTRVDCATALFQLKTKKTQSEWLHLQ